ncbi:MAG: hypothetical protein ABJP45_16415 [Cyclobacteriaceae bacterium]
MKKRQAVFILLFLALSGLAQNKLLVTDFAFLNTFGTPADANIPNYFLENPEMLENTKSKMLSILKQKYDLGEVSVHQNGVSFVSSENKINPLKSYDENHKALAKKGGFDYYFLMTSYITPISRLNHNEGYTFELQVKLSDRKGKKVFTNSIEVPFSALFTDESISSSELLPAEDFYELFDLAFGGVFSDEKADPAAQKFYRSVDTQFDEFVSGAQQWGIKNFMSKNPILSDPTGNEITLRVKGGNETDIDISNASGELPVYGESNDVIVIGIRNPQVQANWVGFFEPKISSDFGELDLAPSATVFLRIGSLPPTNFRLINGRLIGKVEAKVFMISYDPSASMLRVFADQKLILLSQPLEVGEGQNLKVYFKGPEEDLPKAINLHQIYFQAIYSLNQKAGR